MPGSQPSPASNPFHQNAAGTASPSPGPESGFRKFVRRLKPSRRQLVVMGLLVIATFLLCLDVPPPDLSDLPPPSRPYVEEGNVFSVLLDAGNLAKNILEEHRKRARETPTGTDTDEGAGASAGAVVSNVVPNIDDMLTGHAPWDASLARSLSHAAEIAGFWPRWEAAAAAALDAGESGGICQAPLVTFGEDTTPPLSVLRDLFKLACLRARLTAGEGDASLAVRQLTECLRISRRLTEAEGSALPYLTATSLTRITLRHLHRVVIEHPVPPNVLRSALEVVANSRPSKDSLLIAMTDEVRQWHDRFSRWVDDPATISVSDSSSTRKPLPRILWWPFRIFMKPNATLALQARYIRAVAPLIDQDLATLQAADPKAIAGRITHSDDWRRYNPWNFAGRLMSSLVAHEGFFTGRLELQSHISATEALLALRLHEQEASAANTANVNASASAALPETLDALVPDYLATVPRDYFDGQPIKYSHNLRVVWSVGKDNYDPALAKEDAAEKKRSRHVSLTLTP
ncbi:hypothetical protein [Geminisphaera colitermitum]|uniref:hypothetical protein n=1 Tax=Geminisphaera colitermitum TaxID=1148786 RepID=UPI000158C74D|nr:hypothetical protein [Geminisphaera colitermitum]